MLQAAIAPRLNLKDKSRAEILVRSTLNGTTDRPERELSLEETTEWAACQRSFLHFCTTYGRLLEPRPEIANETEKDLDFEAFFEGLMIGANLSGVALDLLYEEVSQVAGTEKPFALWDYQVKAAIWLMWLLAKGESGAIEKCRDMGMTWLVIWFIVWCWLYKPKFSALLGSRKEKAVDNGKLSSLFGKLDYAINCLPEWLRPSGYDRRKHRTKLSIVNPENGNTIEGDSQTEDFGRSERHTFLFLDEYAFWDYDVSGSVSQVARTVLYGSSVNGENHFKRLVERLKSIAGSLVQRWEWWQNPEHVKNDNAWFKRMQNLLDEADFAREVLIDYLAAIKGKYYPVCNLVRLVEGLEWQAGWPSYLSWDYGVRDNTAMIWWQHNYEGTVHRMMFCYTNSGKPIDFYIPFALAVHPNQAVPEFDEYGPVTDADGNIVYQQLTRKWQYTEDDYRFIQRLQDAGVSQYLAHRGDPAGRNRNQDTAMSVVQKLALVGIEVASDTKQNDYLSRREALTEVLLHSEINVDKLDDQGNGSGGAWPAFTAIQQAKYPKRRESSQSTTSPAAPVHDWTSHYRSSAEYYAVGEAPAQPDEEQSAGSLAIFGVNG